MAEFTLTLTETTNATWSGAQVPTSLTWTTPFNHAALVAARRSRADGADLWMRHMTAGRVLVTGISGANTSSCKLAFRLAADLNALSSDAGYRVVFGDLGRQDAGYVAATTPDITATVAAGAAPALSLPAPSFPLSRLSRYDVRRFDYDPASGLASTRRGRANENPREAVVAEWRDVSPEDWYAIRAVWEASRGGCATVVASWWDGLYSLRPTALIVTQSTAGQFAATMDLEEAVLS